MPFLNLERKVWIIKNLEIPVKENIPMRELRWFKDKMKEIKKAEEEGKLTALTAMELDEEWWKKTCEMGLGKTYDEIVDTGLTEPEFRDLMAEVYHFLVTFGSIEGAKQSGFYAPKTKTSESKQ